VGAIRAGARPTLGSTFVEGLRPLGVGELLDAAIRIYKSRARTLLTAVAVPVVPVLIFSALVNFSAQPDLTVDPARGAPAFDGGDLALYIVGAMVGLVATLVASSLATAACFRSISGAYVGDDPDWRESLRFAWKRLGSVLGLTFLTLLATLLGALACLVGVVVPLAFLSVAMPVLLVEGLGAGPSLSRSWRLVRGTFWRVLGIVALSILLATAFQAALSAPLAALFFVDVGPVLQQVLTSLVTAVATVLVTPFSAALTMALYVDLRVRKEGFDLVLWAQRLGNAPTGGFPLQPGARPEPVWAGGPAPGGPSWGPPPPPPPPASPVPSPAPPPSVGAGGPTATGWAPPDDARS